MARKRHFAVFPIERSPGRRLHQAHARMRHGLSQLFREAGYEVSTEAWAVLSHLWEADAPTQLELGERLEKDRHNTSRLIDALEEHGFVRRRASPGDRRVREVALTAKGRAAQEPLTRIVTSFLERIFDGVPDEALDGFFRTLDHIILRLEPSSALPPARRPARRKREV